MAGRRWTEAEDEILRGLYGTQSAQVLAERIGRTENSVWMRARTLGLDKREVPTPWTEDELDELKRCYSTEAPTAIAARLGRTPSSVYQQARVFGLDSRKSLIGQSVVGDYFDVIDTAEKAYILGLVAADGNVMASGRVTFGLHSSDVDAVRLVRDRIAPDAALSYWSKRPFVQMAITSRPLAAGLARWGVVPRKSRVLEWPSALEEMQRPYLLGYFDGDGSAYTVRNRYPGWTVCSGSRPFLVDMKEFIHQVTGVTLEKIHHRPNTDLYQVATTGRGAYVLDQWLHQEPGLGFARKRIPESILARYQL